MGEILTVAHCLGAGAVGRVEKLYGFSPELLAAFYHIKEQIPLRQWQSSMEKMQRAIDKLKHQQVINE
jgi:hypothetical protein